MIDIDSFILANSLQNHPVLRETLDYKVKYYTVLEYFTLKHSKSNEIAKAILVNYKNAFGCGNSDTANEATIKSYAKKVVGNKFDFKSFKLFTYRYGLLCDVLIINSFNDKKIVKKIFADIKTIFNERYHSKMERLFALLYDGIGNIKEFDLAQHQIDCWQKNKAFLEKPKKRILITANMSAGKSTLINALVGKVVNRTMNDACTAKIHYIYDQAFEDNYTHKWDYEVNLNADKKALLEDDERNSEAVIIVATHFQMLGARNSRLCIIDTPGVNNSTNKDHGELTKQTILNEQYDLLVYVVNAENAGTEDDLRHLMFIKENAPQSKIMFVLNKLDRFKKSEDSIAESIENLRKDLIGHGFENPTICPVSSYAGDLAKKVLSRAELNADEADEYAVLEKKFCKQEYDLSRFYSEVVVGDIAMSNAKGADLLIRSGMLGFEQTLLQRS